MFLLLNALVGLGLLTLRKGRYSNTPLSLRHLDRRSLEAISNLLWLLGHHWKDWTGIPHALRHGRPGWDPITETPEFPGDSRSPFTSRASFSPRPPWPRSAS